MKKFLIAGFIFIVIFIVIIVIFGRVVFPDNVAETSLDGGEKGLKTRVYQTNLETAKKAAKEIIPNLTSYGSNWKVVDETESSIKAEVPVLVFTDDLEVKMKSVEINGGVQIDVVSKSRVGKSDFGENARSVRKVLNALDEKLGNN